MTEEPRDSELIRRIRRGEIEAFDLLYNRYRTDLAAYLYRYIRDYQGAEDVLQEALYDVYKRLREGKYTEEGSFQGWLFTIARNFAKKYIAKKKRMISVLDEPYGYEDGESAAAYIPSQGEGVDEQAEEKEEEKVLMNAIAQMPPKYKEPLLLYTVKGLTYGDVAKALSITIGTVGVRIQRARVLLYKVLRKKGILKRKK